MKNKIGRPPKPDGEKADRHIILRVSSTRKGAYVESARKKGKKLSEWCFEHLDKASEM